jgi:hypothetical protein
MPQAIVVDEQFGTHRPGGRRRAAERPPMTIQPSTLVRPLPVASSHAAFPGACLLGDGTVLLVWRAATDHDTSRDGTIQGARSTDQGLSWSVPVTLVGDHRDLRDPAVGTDGETVRLTYFTGSATQPAQGCYTRASTDGGHSFGPETRIDTLGYAAISAPLVRRGPVLLAVYYGRAAPGETRDSVWLAASTDGLAWSRQRIADGHADGRDYQEPWLVADDAGLVVLFRWGNTDGIGLARSADATTWSAPARAFDGSGRPSAALTTDGALVVVYRGLPDKAAWLRASQDRGLTWYPPRRVAPAPDGQMTYAAPVDTAPGLVLCPYATETGPAQSRLWLTYLRSTPGTDPLGGAVLDPATRIITGSDLALACDDFHRPDGVPGHTPGGLAWSVAGSVRIQGGTLRSGVADGVPDLAWVDTQVGDVDIEADLSWVVTSGHGIVFRLLDATSYLLVTTESAGAAIRCYRVATGAATLIKATPWTVRPGPYHRFRVSVRADIASWFLNGQFVDSAQLPAHPSTGRHGLKLNEADTGRHRCRRFVISA